MSDKILTKHQQRMRNVRQRMNRVVRHLDPPTGRGMGNADGYTTFAVRMAEVASKEGIQFSRQRTTTALDTPKDLAHSLRRFGKGKSGLIAKKLDLIDRTCDVLEPELQRPPAVEHPAVPDQDTGEREVVKVDFTAAAVVDPEIAAMADVYGMLRKLPNRAARQRVMDYALDRCESEDKQVSQ